jgi:mono/diheme cytochrome c family protein
MIRRRLLPARPASSFAIAFASIAMTWAIETRSSEPASVSPRAEPAAAPPSAPVPAKVARARIKSAPPSAAAFAAATRLLEHTCAQCHSGADADAGFDVSRYQSLGSLAADRAGWELIFAKLRSGEMPPSGIERRVAEIDDLLAFLDAEFERADEDMAPDSGRVTLRRLNRAEYSNTIRDLLSVEFRADRDFPTDDSGDGFDNIGDVLTISPVLMERYLAAAGRIAERAIAAEPLPNPVKVDYSLKFENLRRLDPSNVELTHRFDFDADYDLRVGMPGQRPDGAKPVTLGLWVDGKLTHTTSVATTASKLAYLEPYSEESFRVSLPEGDHRLRLGFINDDFVKTLGEDVLYKNKSNKWVASVAIIGPFASKKAKPSRGRILVCEPKTGDACVEKILSNLARRAYRRPVTSTEVAELERFVDMAEADGQSVEQGLALALQAMLVSPHFLFHVERDLYPDDPSKIHRITDVELASRLSYFLWSSMPDEELSSLASRGRLSTPHVLAAQVERMLADPKSLALAENFAGQWLETRNLDSIRPDPDKFPAWGPDLREAMKTETQLFFAAILRKNRSIAEFLDARYTFLNELLAQHYGIEGVRGPEFRRVALTGDQRGGVLGHGSVLAVSSYPTRTSVVLRGKYILQNILGSAPPPPPPDVPALDEEAVATSGSLRQQMEQHRANPTCASCHSRMDPLGFGLENYDVLGRWRTEDGGLPVDASGTLPDGKSFATPAEMRRILGGMLPDVSRSLTEKMLTYALGRGLERYDKPTVRAITARLAAKGNGLKTLVHEIVNSLPFQSRRAERVSKN